MQLETDRLILRPPSILDAPRIRELAGEFEVAKGTLNIPHPYPEGAAEAFIQSATMAWENLSSFNFAIVGKADGLYMGGISLRPDPTHKRAELGYWIGIPYWGQSYVTEAAQRLVDWGFQYLGLLRIHSQHFGNNPASGRVMQKIGMKYEGTLRQHFIRFGERHDTVLYGVLRGEWQAAQLSE